MTEPAEAEKRVPYAKYAFWNPYNLTLLVGAGTAAAATGNWVLATIAAGAEALWMLFAPDSKALRRIWFDRRHQAELESARKERRARALAQLTPDAVHRCQTLAGKKLEIDRLCAENPALTADLLRGELQKLEALVDSFVDLQVTSARYEQYLSDAGVDDLERNIRRCQGQLEHGSSFGDSPQKRQLLQKNLDVLLQRREKLQEISSYVGSARTQLDLIENTFQLLADQIVTMRSPQELSSQLDDLMDGVEAIRQTSRETEKLLATVEQ